MVKEVIILPLSLETHSLSLKILN